MVLADRGVVAQAAAAETIAVRAAQAAGAIEPLLGAFTTRVPRPGRKRTGSILRALSSLAIHANASQKARMLRLAVEKLQLAPRGALAVLRALGPAASRALPIIREFSKKAYRFERHYIQKHVLPAIIPCPVRPRT